MQKWCGPSAQDCGVRGVGAEMREEWEEIGLHSATPTVGLPFAGGGSAFVQGPRFQKASQSLGHEAVFKDRAPFAPNTQPLQSWTNSLASTHRPGLRFACLRISLTSVHTQARLGARAGPEQMSLSPRTGSDIPRQEREDTCPLICCSYARKTENSNNNNSSNNNNNGSRYFWSP